MSTKHPFVIVIPVFDGVDLLDVTGPYELLGWMGNLWQEAHVQVVTAGEADPDTGAPKMVKSVSGFTFQPDKTFANCPHANLLLVPGGAPDDLPTPCNNEPLFKFMRRQYDNATYIASVCVGALVLASGGFLTDCNATTHWQFLDRLRAYKDIAVASGYPRYVWCQVNGKTFVTGGGISSSLDTALFLIQKITGSDLIAGQVQLLVQYNPQPPLNDGDPSVASPQVLRAVAPPLC